MCARLNESYRIVFPLVEADVSVEDLDEKLDLQRRVHALVGDLQSLLQTLHHPLTIADLDKQGELLAVYTDAIIQMGNENWGLTFLLKSFLHNFTSFST